MFYTVKISPINKILFRDIMPFEYGGIARNIAPKIPPYTIVGTLRSLFNDCDVAKLNFDGDGCEDVNKYTPSSWRLLATGVLKDEDEKDIYYFLLPADIFVRESPYSTKSFNIVFFDDKVINGFKVGLFSSHKVSLSNGLSVLDNHYVSLPIPNFIKSKSPNQGILLASLIKELMYISGEGLRDYILGELDLGSSDKYLLKGNEIGRKFIEPKVNLRGGAGEGRHLKTVVIHHQYLKGGYYSVEFYKLNSGYRFFSLIELKDTECFKADNIGNCNGKIKRFGGEGGMAEFSFEDGLVEPLNSIYKKDSDLRKKLIDRIKEKRRLKILLLTPAVLLFRSDISKVKYTRHTPFDLEIRYGDCVLEIVSILSRGYEYVGGWSLNRDRRKELLLVLPPASVVYVRIKSENCDILGLVDNILVEGFPPKKFYSLNNNDIKDFFEKSILNVFGSAIPAVW